MTHKFRHNSKIMPATSPLFYFCNRTT